MRLNCDYMDLDSLFEQFQEKVPDCERLTRNEVKRFEAIFYKLAEISNGGWVSVNDRLPEKSGDVLVYKNGIYDVYHFSKRWQKFNAYDLLNSADNALNVTHWQKLPEPPKEEVDEDHV